MRKRIYRHRFLWSLVVWVFAFSVEDVLFKHPGSVMVLVEGFGTGFLIACFAVFVPFTDPPFGMQLRLFRVGIGFRRSSKAWEECVRHSNQISVVFMEGVQIDPESIPPLPAVISEVPLVMIRCLEDGRKGTALFVTIGNVPPRGGKRRRRRIRNVKVGELPILEGLR